MLGRTPVFGHSALEIPAEGLAHLHRVHGGEDALRNPCRQLLAGLGGSGLKQYRVALRRTRHVEWPSHREIFAFVVEEVDLVGTEIATRSPVPNERIIVPTVPQSAHHFRELERTVVALAVLVVLGTAEIPRFRLVGRGDHIPAGSAMPDVVE